MKTRRTGEQGIDSLDERGTGRTGFTSYEVQNSRLHHQHEVERDGIRISIFDFRSSPSHLDSWFMIFVSAK